MDSNMSHAAGTSPLTAPRVAEDLDISTLHIPEHTRPLKILSLDGGGVRGLSSLIILRRIMYKVKPTDELHDITKPCEYFDMICGTSTGGLIAIMLGRLRMGVQETIDAYVSLAENVFHEKTRLPIYPKWVGSVVGKPRFSGTKLADAIKSIVQKQTGSEETPMLDTRVNACKVFVCATRTANTESALLRTYRSNEEDSSQGAIWQAARATSAAPTFFPSIQFGNPPANYVDGAMRYNNPIRLLMREAAIVWGPDADFSCVLSIGTGVPTAKKLGSLGHQVLFACAKLATSAENVAEDFGKDQGRRLHQEGKYFRFNVVHGLGNVKLEEWQSFDLLDAATKSYLKDVDSDIQRCSGRLQNPIAGSLPGELSTHLISHTPNDIRGEYIDVTLASSPHFTGRSDILKSISKFFSVDQRSSSQIAILIGLGGIGKTQIALKYFERTRSLYSIVLFVECNTRQESIAAFVRFAYRIIDEDLRLCPKIGYDEAVKKSGFSGLLGQQATLSVTENHLRLVKAVKAWLGRQEKKFLIIFDNADDPAKMNLAEFIPHQTKGDVIITTRDADAKAFGRPFFIDEMQKQEAAVLLAKASNLSLDSPELRKTAEQIAEVLGCLPLAIDLAGGYLSNSDSDITTFLSSYQHHARSLLSRMPNDGMLGYRHSAFTTWEMSFERLVQISPSSVPILQLLGFVNNQDISDLLYNPQDPNERIEWSLHTESHGFSGTFACLSKLCLIRRNGKLRTYDIHPIVHVWIRERLDSSQQAIFSRDAMKFVARTLPDFLPENPNSVDAFKVHRRLYPHVQAAWGNVKAYAAPAGDGKSIPFLAALDIVATSLRIQGQYELAEEVLLRLLKGNELAHGPRNQYTLDTLANLASNYDLRGNISKSEELYKQALEGLLAVLGPEHRKTLSVLHNLANVLKYRNKSGEAEELYKQALDGRQKLGEEDHDTLETMDALASLYYSTRRTADAEPLRRFVLDVRERRLGPLHHETLITVLNMGMLCSGLGQSEQALTFFNRAYEGLNHLLGTQNPTTLNALSLIAVFYANVGHSKKAESMFREILAGQKLSLGSLHPDTLWTQNCLGCVLFMKEKSEGSVQIVENALKDLRSVLGPEHLDTLWVASNLAMIYVNIRRFKEAEALQETVVEGYVKELGEDHINTLYMINDLGDCYMREEKFDYAHEMFKKAFEGKKRNFGLKSPHTLYTATFLANTMKELGNEKDAEDLYKSTLETVIEILGPEHADVCLCSMYLADLFVGQRRLPEARELYQKVHAIRLRLQGPNHKNTRHLEDLLFQINQRIDFPNDVANQVPMKSRQGLDTPSQMGFRGRGDTVQVLF